MLSTMECRLSFGLLIVLGLAASGCPDDSGSEDGAAGTGSADTTTGGEDASGTGSGETTAGTTMGGEDGSSGTGDVGTTTEATMGESGDDDDDSVPTDEPAPDPWNGGGGDMELEVIGPGPWPDAPAATFEWSNPWGPDDSPGMICRFNSAAGTYQIRSSFGFAFKGFGEGGAVNIQLSGFTGAGTYEVPEGEVSFRWEFDDEREVIEASVATTAAGTCSVTVDDLWWTGAFECTGLEVEGRPVNAGRVGPIDMSGSWSCLGIEY